MIEILAILMMNWRLGQSERGELAWEIPRTSQISYLVFLWNPFTDRNALAEVEEQLTEDQRDSYIKILFDGFSIADGWSFRHADPAVCAEVLARVVAPEEFQDD
jgi:hypothetical protein